MNISVRSYISSGLAAATATYGSNPSVDNLVLRRAVILDETCDPILRTTLNEHDGTLEFAAFTATADGESKWTITATAELNILPPEPRGHEVPDAAAPITSISGDEFNRGARRPLPPHANSPLRVLRLTRRTHDGPRPRRIGDGRTGRMRYHDRRPTWEHARGDRRLHRAIAGGLLSHVTRSNRQGPPRDPVVC